MTPSAPSGYKMRQLSNFTPQQQELFQKRLGGLNKGGGLDQSYDYLNRLASGDEELFKELEAPAYKNLEKGLAQTGNRFSQFGAQDSSAFQNALAGQSSELATNLQSRRGDLRREAIQALLGQSDQLLNAKPYENILEQQDQGFNWTKMLGELLPILLSAFGPGGALAGQVGKMGINAATNKGGG